MENKEKCNCKCHTSGRFWHTSKKCCENSTLKRDEGMSIKSTPAEEKEGCYNCNLDIKFDGKMPLCTTCKNKPPMNNTLPASPSPSSDSMEERFEEKFGKMNFRGNIIAFIKSEKALSEREAREEVVKAIKEMKLKYELSGNNKIFNLTIDEIIINLTNTRD